MEDYSEPTQKKRRVTKACDRCRQKRQRCETGPSPEGACAVCIASGCPDLCTFTRQSKRRGPQRGVAQSLGEKLNALERLMGHLLLVDKDSILSIADNFFNPSIPSLASPEGYLQAFRATTLPQRLEELSPSPPVEQINEVVASDDKMSVGEGGWGESPIASTSRHSPIITATNRPSPQSRLPSFSFAQVLQPTQLPNLQSSYPSETNNIGLQTLATAAFADYSTPERLEAFEERTRNSPKAISSNSYPPLPPEMIRHQLVDLYFSQIVHPTYPMLDKSRFFRWSAQLPQLSAPGQPSGSLGFPPELYYAVFAISVPYLNPAAARMVAPAETYAAAARAALFESLSNPSLESVQAACILSLYDWGVGALDRAWILSSLAIALSIRLALHLKIKQVDQSLNIETDPESYKVKTFFSSVIIHTLLSLRLNRAPMIALEDYNVPLPPSDGPENYELWRTDPPDELRGIYDPLTHSSPRQSMYTPRIHAVRSCALSAFSQTAKLSLIAIGIIRYGVNSDSDHLTTSPREVERQNLANRLASWERELPGELRLSEELRGIDGMSSRSRHVVELHLLLCTLYQHLAPPPELLNIAFNPAPEASHYQVMILGQFLNLFTLYRCLPTIELSLNSLAIILFQSNGTRAQHDSVLRAFLELGNIFPAASSSYATLQIKSRPKNSLPQPTPLHMQAIPPPRPDDPLRGYLDFSGDPQSVTQYLDFGVWDQNDLLIPLGLVVDSGLTWTVPEPDTLDMKPSLLMDDALFSGMPGSPMAMGVAGMRTPMSILTPPQGSITPTGNSGGMNGNGLGGAYSTDLFERWLDKGLLDFSGQQQQ